MFTGIIEEKGRIKRIIRGRNSTIDVAASGPVKKGESVGLQGICFTVTKVLKNSFSVEAMTQTKQITTLPRWKTGDLVNVERALVLGGRLGGHIMLGHVDEVGKLIRIAGNDYYFQVSSRNAKYLIPQGSIGIDGVSLTIASVSQNIFTVSLIPHSLKSTTMGDLRINAFVNIEYDYLVKILMTRLISAS